MAQFVKKENLVISIGEYEKDGEMRKEWKTIGEIITMAGDDGKQFQFFKTWGPAGVQEGKVFEQKDRQQGGQQQQQQAPQQQQGGYQQQAPQQQQNQQQPQQQNNYQQQQNNPNPF